MRPNQERRFWRKVDLTGGMAACWEWTGARYPSGYGHLFLNYKDCYPHRVAYELVVGPIPDGLTIDHLCRNRGCVNPSHLESVSLRENILRSPLTQASRNARKTVCSQGHPYSPQNTVWIGPQKTHRTCRECRNQRVVAPFGGKGGLCPPRPSAEDLEGDGEPPLGYAPDGGGR